MIKVIVKRTVWVSALLLAVAHGIHAKSNRVAVKAEAAREYILDRARDGSKTIQTYHLVEGIRFAGNVLDEEMDAVGFNTIAEHLALNLERQNFVSATGDEKADLLIMVHHGATNLRGWNGEDGGYYGETLRDDYSNDFNLFGANSKEGDKFQLSKAAIPDFTGARIGRGVNSREWLKRQYITSSLLGMEKVHSRKISSYKAYILQGLVHERRYFFVLTAFDLPALQQGEKKVLWTTRYSVRTIGQSYDEAIKELNVVAGHFFGKNFRDLISRRSSDQSLVKIGELEVIPDDEVTVEAYKQ